jgi:hypothetical protein
LKKPRLKGTRGEIEHTKPDGANGERTVFEAAVAGRIFPGGLVLTETR